MNTYAQQTAPAERPTALTALLLRYVTGQIADPTWTQFSTIVDSPTDVTPLEREAMMAFVNDAYATLGSHAVELPSASEAREVLNVTRLV